MARIVILPKTLLYLNRDTGAGVWWDRREGLLVRGPDGAWGRTTEIELRRAPRIHQAWIRFARHLTLEEAALAAGAPRQVAR
jgi:hypothetical protein